MATRGRRPKLTPSIQKTILDFIANGNWLYTAAAAAGVHRSTVLRWVQDGERATSGIYHDFYVAYRKAEAKAEAKCVARIRMAGQSGDWKADAWYLERRNPEQWCRREKVDVAKHEEANDVKRYIKRKDVRDLLDQVASRISLDGDAGKPGD